jgi:hypothetical protein
MTYGQPIPILLFADSILGIRPYDWQANILLNYEAGYQTAAACADFTGKLPPFFRSLRSGPSTISRALALCTFRQSTTPANGGEYLVNSSEVVAEAQRD